MPVDAVALGRGLIFADARLSEEGVASLNLCAPNAIEGASPHVLAELALNASWTGIDSEDQDPAITISSRMRGRTPFLRARRADIIGTNSDEYRQWVTGLDRDGKELRETNPMLRVMHTLGAAGVDGSVSKGNLIDIIHPEALTAAAHEITRYLVSNPRVVYVDDGVVHVPVPSDNETGQMVTSFSEDIINAVVAAGATSKAMSELVAKRINTLKNQTLKNGQDSRRFRKEMPEAFWVNQ